ncbi:hypothetical protein Efla_004543 [Eimeria flavescens]
MLQLEAPISTKARQCGQLRVMAFCPTKPQPNVCLTGSGDSSPSLHASAALALSLPHWAGGGEGPFQRMRLGMLATAALSPTGQEDRAALLVCLNGQQGGLSPCSFSRNSWTAGDPMQQTLKPTNSEEFERRCAEDLVAPEALGSAAAADCALLPPSLNFCKGGSLSLGEGPLPLLRVDGTRNPTEARPQRKRQAVVAAAGEQLQVEWKQEEASPPHHQPLAVPRGFACSDSPLHAELQEAPPPSLEPLSLRLIKLRVLESQEGPNPLKGPAAHEVQQHSHQLLHHSLLRQLASQQQLQQQPFEQQAAAQASQSCSGQKAAAAAAAADHLTRAALSTAASPWGEQQPSQWSVASNAWL